MEDSQHGLQIYSTADNFVVFTGYFRASGLSHTIETR